MLPSFLPRLWPCRVHVTPTSLQLRLSLFPSLLLTRSAFTITSSPSPPPLFPSCFSFPSSASLHSFPHTLATCLSGADDAPPIHWELNGDSYHRQPFLHGLALLSLPFYGFSLIILNLAYCYSTFSFYYELRHPPSLDKSVTHSQSRRKSHKFIQAAFTETVIRAMKSQKGWEPLTDQNVSLASDVTLTHSTL